MSLTQLIFNLQQVTRKSLFNSRIIDFNAGSKKKITA